MKNSLFLFVALIIPIALGAVFIMYSSEHASSAEVPSNGSKPIQNDTLRIQREPLLNETKARRRKALPRPNRFEQPFLPRAFSNSATTSPASPSRPAKARSEAIAGSISNTTVKKDSETDRMLRDQRGNRSEVRQPRPRVEKRCAISKATIADARNQIALLQAKTTELELALAAERSQVHRIRERLLRGRGVALK